MQSRFQTYKAGKEREFKEYRDRINAEFADYMRQVWPEFRSNPAVPLPALPEPPAPVVKNPDATPGNEPVAEEPILIDNVEPAPEPVAPPQPVVPLPKPDAPVLPEPVAPAPEPDKPAVPELPRPVEPAPEPVAPAEPAKPTRPTFSFNFYGAECHIPLESRHRFTLKSATEKACADGWNILSSDSYLPVISQCVEYRDKLRLGDWGYVLFLEKMTTAFFSSSRLNEARLMQMFILTQSGYKVRIARTGERLVLLLPSEEQIFGYSFLTVGRNRYYILDKSVQQSKFFVFDREFPKEQTFSLRIPRLPLLPLRASAPRHLQSSRDKSLVADISVNRNLIDFYNDYPLSSRFDMYSNASLSDRVKEQLYPELQKSISGKSPSAAANILLHFVQTSLDYKTDDEQFGTERPLFGDETLFYPYSDCEDRAILYSILVRDLLGLDVVFLGYPAHIATAVCFGSEDVAGDYLRIDGSRYTVCDPTYINADIGEAMPQFKHTAATVIRIR